MNELIILENAYIEQFKTIDDDEKKRMEIASELIDTEIDKLFFVSIC